MKTALSILDLLMWAPHEFHVLGKLEFEPRSWPISILADFVS